MTTPRVAPAHFATQRNTLSDLVQDDSVARSQRLRRRLLPAVKEALAASVEPNLLGEPRATIERGRLVIDDVDAFAAYLAGDMAARLIHHSSVDRKREHLLD